MNTSWVTVIVIIIAALFLIPAIFKPLQSLLAPIGTANNIVEDIWGGLKGAGRSAKKLGCKADFLNILC